MKWWIKGLLGIAFAVTAAQASAQAEQYIPILSYRVGPYAAGGSGYFGGAIDYFTLVNMNGGINGVKIKWEECETEYNAARGVECFERLKTRNGGASTRRTAAAAHHARCCGAFGESPRPGRTGAFAGIIPGAFSA